MRLINAESHPAAVSPERNIKGPRAAIFFNMLKTPVFRSMLIFPAALLIFSSCRHEVPSRSAAYMTWWGNMSFEIEIDDDVIQFDPLFFLYRKTDHIFCSTYYPDHCNIPAIERIVKVSENLKIYEPPNSECVKRFPSVTESMEDGDIIENRRFKIKAYRGKGPSELDLMFLLQDKKNNISFFHSGDAVGRDSFEDMKKVFEEMEPRKIDYYICALSKLSIEQIEYLLREYEPGYIIPAHYRFRVIDLDSGDNGTSVPLGSVDCSEPEFSIEFFEEEINRYIAEEKLKTRILRLSPGERFEYLR